MSIRNKALALLLCTALVSPLHADGISGPSGVSPSVATALAGSAACTPWTPTDQSTAGLAFTAVSAQFCRLGNLVFAYGTLTYPSTADPNNAVISLPVAVPNQTYAKLVTKATSVNTFLQAVPNSSTAALVSNVDAPVTNATLSTITITFILIYPAS